MPTPCWLKHLCSIRVLVPVSSFLSLSLSLRLFLWSTEIFCVHFPVRASQTLSRRCSVPSPHQEGAWGLLEQSKRRAGALLAFWVNQGISASFSLLYFLISRLQTIGFWSIKGPQQRCPTSLIIREMQIKTTIRFHLTPVRMAITKKSTRNNFWRGCGDKGTLLPCWSEY